MTRQVGLTDDADDAVAIVHHWYAPDLMSRHQPQAALDQVLLVAGEDPIAHTFVNTGAAWVESASDDPHHDVAVGDHADQPPTVIHDGQRAAIAPDHRARRVLGRIAEVDRADVARHHVAHARLAGPVERGPERTIGASLADAVVEPLAPLSVGDPYPHALPFFRLTLGGRASGGARNHDSGIVSPFDPPRLFSPSPGRPEPS